MRVIDGVQRITLGIPVPLVDLREDLLQYRHDFLIQRFALILLIVTYSCWIV